MAEHTPEFLGIGWTVRPTKTDHEIVKNPDANWAADPATFPVVAHAGRRDVAEFIVLACNSHKALTEALEPLAAFEKVLLPSDAFAGDATPLYSRHTEAGLVELTRGAILAAAKALALARGEPARA